MTLTPQQRAREIAEKAFAEFCIHDWNRPSYWGEDDTARFVERLSARLTAALNAEIEACAVVCDEKARIALAADNRAKDRTRSRHYDDCAAAIRARRSAT
jgi:hypothetical protein